MKIFDQKVVISTPVDPVAQRRADLSRKQAQLLRRASTLTIPAEAAEFLRGMSREQIAEIAGLYQRHAVKELESVERQLKALQ